MERLVQHYLIIIRVRKNEVVAGVLVVGDGQVADFPCTYQVHIELAVVGAGCVVALQSVAALDAQLEVLAFAHLNVERHVVDAPRRGVGRETGEGGRLIFQVVKLRISQMGVFALHAIVLHRALLARLSVEACDAELRRVLPHAGVHLVDAGRESVGRNGLVESEIVGDDARRAGHVASPLPFEVRAVRDAAVVVCPGIALPAVDGTVGSLVDGRLHVPVVCHALRILLEVVVRQHLVAKLVLRERLLCDLLHMEVVHHEVAGAVLVAPLVGAVRADAELEAVAVLQGDIDHHALHVLRRGGVEAASVAGEGRAVIGIGQVVVARRAVAVIGLISPVLHDSPLPKPLPRGEAFCRGTPLLFGRGDGRGGCKQAGRAVEVLLHPHAAAHLVDAGAQLLGRYLLIEMQGLVDGAVRGGLADVGLLSVPVLRRLVHAALEGHACGRLLPACRRLRGVREALFERGIGEDAPRDVNRDGCASRQRSVGHGGVNVEAVLQLRDAARGVNRLHATVVLVDGLDGSQGCRLAQDHIDRLHADAAVGDVRGREADGHDDVARLALQRCHGAVGDVVRALRQVALHVALVLHLAVHDVASAVVRVHRVRAPGNRVVRLLVLQAVVLRHHHAPNHAARLADVELRREVPVVLVLVERIAPEVELVLDVLRHARVGPEDVEEALRVVLVQLGYRVALLVGCLGIVPAVANHVGREGAVVVVVGLVGVPRIWPRGVLHIRPLEAVAVAAPALLLHPSEQQFVSGGVVVVRHLGRYRAERLRLGERQAVVVGLDVVVARAVGRHGVAHDAPQQAARRVARHDVGVHAVAELMLVEALRAVLRLAVLRLAFAPDGIGDAGASHEVALVTAIHEDSGTNRTQPRFFILHS